ncbi:FAD-dependent monooxygenase [Nocardioides sp. Kera G14]|uniref:FAD-dependent monooxygenase n=1 Tax=Nocardioides sp. Kera G14 TaxID=2884264 RepID=UPI001D118E5E|nr:FAD-dependent monooxygenase [Nocardioides sp. Kera G14]UDY23441.1 FAD-dependent monooxygenase [Nocardioides sp. Kera G14]
MQFHHHGYVTTDPRIQPAAGLGLDRPDELPDEMDLLIVGAGPAGILLAAQMSQYPTINTRIIERRGGRLEMGQADGIQARSVETFQAFGFAERVIAEAFHLTAMNFWSTDPDDPSRIVRTQRTVDDPDGFSEFPHLIINQARVIDYFAEAARFGPGRIAPDYGWELIDLKVLPEGERPVEVTLRRTAGEGAGEERTVRAVYVVGADGARSAVREALGMRLEGTQAMHAWAVLDALAVTDFPDIRTKCQVQTPKGGIQLIPREGGHLFRMYVDLGEVDESDRGAVRSTSLDAAIAKANEILAPYTLDVRHVPWHSVYEVGHRLTSRFDDVPADEVGTRAPRVFIAGDACHTHSAKAGQGMNVSMQDTFNLGWKLGQVISELSPASLLDTYAAERQVVAKNLIDFDREWSTMLTKDPAEIPPDELAEFYVKTAEFPAGFRTHYAPSIITGRDQHQALATGFPLGKRFHSAGVVRVADANPMELGHHARADGRWRIYAFADGARPADSPALQEWAEWMLDAGDSPLGSFNPADAELDALFDVKVVFQGRHDEVDLRAVPTLFLPRVGPFDLIDYEKVHATDPARDIFSERGVARTGALVVVRPDMYVAHVLPLAARDELTAFFALSMRSTGGS